MSDQIVHGEAGGQPDPTEPKTPERSLPELLSRLTDDVNRLLSTQLELAKVEIKEEAKKAATGAGLLSGGAVAALLALLVLSHAAAWGLIELMSGFEWLAFLIVGAIWAAAAAVLALQGRKKLQQTDPVPHATIAEIQADRDLARDELSRD